MRRESVYGLQKRIWVFVVDFITLRVMDAKFWEENDDKKILHSTREEYIKQIE